MLARGGPERVLEIAKLADELTGSDRRRALSQLLLLSGLRRLTGKVRMELKAMGVSTDITKNWFVMDVIRDDRAKILRGQLEVKFGRLPKWIDERLESAKSTQIERWLMKFATADTLEGVLGKK